LQSMDNYYLPNGNFRAWLYRIAHNTVVDYYRTFKTTVDIEKAENFASNYVNAEDLLIQEENMNEILAAISKLTDEQKSVVTLRFVEGLTNSEIAKVLDKNEEAIRALCSRGLKSLRSNLTN
jgi:RNA polymerase sigma-70 factor, ECF subfamily